MCGCVHACVCVCLCVCACVTGEWKVERCLLGTLYLQTFSQHQLVSGPLDFYWWMMTTGEGWGGRGGRG